MIIQPVNGGSAAAFIRRLNNRNEYIKQLEILDSIIYVLAGPTASPTISPTIDLQRAGEQNLRTSNIEQDDPEESTQISPRNNPHLDLIEKVGSKQILPVNNSQQKDLFPTSTPTVSLSVPTIPTTTNTAATSTSSRSNKISSKEKIKVEGAVIIAFISGCGLIGCAILLGFYCYQLRKVQQEQQHKSTY